MDIVSRLKLFMEYSNIAISQFADTCKIPRPTMSQILNGRNKKISDELISKIHLAYPHLSVLWLMFGEGSMMADGNIRFSEGKKEANPNGKPGQTPQNERNNLFASSDIPPTETSKTIKLDETFWWLRRYPITESWSSPIFRPLETKGVYSEVEREFKDNRVPEYFK